MEAKRKKVMESLGFTYEGDYKEIMEELKKSTKEKHPVFKSRLETNDPNNENYAKGENSKKYLLSIEEAFHVYDEHLNEMTDIFNIDKDYLRDEETAFKNALVFHSTQFYYISYEIQNDYHEKIKTDYFSTEFDQKPYTNYFFPILENMFKKKEDGE